MSQESQDSSDNLAAWVLTKDGILRSNQETGDLLHLDPENHGAGDVPVGTNQPVVIQFASFADGRGFSLARRLRETHGASLRLIADGHLVPDQARHAFQSGFDAILISDNALTRHGKQAWDAALQRAVGTLYLGEASGGGIWTRRLGDETAQQAGA